MSSFDDDVPASATAAERAVAGGFWVFGAFRLLFCKQRMRIRSSTRSSTADPTEIPIMAAFESFLGFFGGGIWCGSGIEDGDGDGEGKDGLHGGNGPPQRARFPANALAGNFDRDAGIEPLRRL